MRALVFGLLIAVANAGLADDVTRSRGQTLYLPVYSHLPHGNVALRGKPGIHPLSVLVSVRNTDPRQPIRVLSARYNDSSGARLRDYLAAPRVLPPLGTLELFVERNDLAGGSGASFLVVWQADKAVNTPIVEAVHADISGNRTLAFITSARAIH